MLKLHDQEPTLKNVVEIQKQSALVEAKELEPSPNERIVVVPRLTEEL
jgi:hypothetical protein